MTIIDRYISKLFLSYFAAALVVFLTIFMTVDALTTVVRYPDATPVMFAKYYGYFIPEVLYQLIPVACLLAAILTLSNLQKSHELTALHSAGIGLRRVCAPIIVLVILVSTLGFWAADIIVPPFTQKKNYTFIVEIRERPNQYATVRTNKIWYRSNNTLYNIGTLDATEKLAYGLTMYTFSDDWKLVQMISAKRVHMQSDHWDLFDGSVTLFPEESSFPLAQAFTEKTISVEQSVEDLQDNPHPTDVLSLGQLSRYISRHKAAGLDTTRYEVDYHAKFGFGLSGLVMVLLGIPFSLVGSARSGGGMMANLAFCLLVVFVYWSVYNSGLALGYHGAIDPVIAGWIPNIICLSVATFLLSRIQR